MITTLSAEQVALLDEFKEAWMGHALSCEPANRPVAEEGVRLTYAALGLPPPGKIVWCGSPRSGAIARAILLSMIPREMGANLWRPRWSLLNQAHDLYARINATVRSQIHSAFDGDPMSIQPLATLLTSVPISPRDPMRRALETIWVKERPEVWASAWTCVADAVGTRSGAGYKVDCTVKEGLDQACFGQHDAPWLAFFDYCRTVLNLRDETNFVHGQILVAQSAGWFWPFQNLCIISDRPLVNHVNEKGRSHCLTGPAFQYRDQYKVYAFHGYHLPDYVMEAPERMTPAIIADAWNSDLRCTLIHKYGQSVIWPM